MVSARNIYLSFPVNTLVSINFTVNSSTYYNLFFPEITNDNQLGAELNHIIANGITTTNIQNTTNQLYITVQGTNKFFLSNILTITSTNYTTTNAYSKFIAIKSQNNQYGWFQFINDTLYAPYSNNFASTTSNNFTGSNTFNNFLPSSTQTPVNSSDLTTKNYVDSAISNSGFVKSGFTKQQIQKFTINATQNNIGVGIYGGSIFFANNCGFSNANARILSDYNLSAASSNTFTLYIPKVFNVSIGSYYISFSYTLTRISTQASNGTAGQAIAFEEDEKNFNLIFTVIE